MAKIEFEGIEEYRARIVSLGVNLEGTCKRAVYPAAGVVIEAIKDNTPVWANGESQGDLKESAKLANFKDEDGYIYTAVYFAGYDRRGVPNPIKARVLESGSTTRPKHPFIRPAMNKVKNTAEKMIEQEFNKIIDEQMNK